MLMLNGGIPVTKQIEDFVEEPLEGQARQNALDFIAFLRNHGVAFYRAHNGYWKTKVDYWVKLGEECLCFIAIQNPDEPENSWTVWSDACSAYESDIPEEDIKHIAWEHIDFCAHCGSCSGGKRKTVFGKTFDDVCGCTFRVDDPSARDLLFLKKMIEIRKSVCL